MPAWWFDNHKEVFLLNRFKGNLVDFFPFFLSPKYYWFFCLYVYRLLLLKIKIIKNHKEKDFFTYRTASKKITQKAIHARRLYLCEGRTRAPQPLIFKQINWYFHVTGLKMKTRRDLWLYLKSENIFSVTECFWKTNSYLFIGCIKKSLFCFFFISLFY